MKDGKKGFVMQSGDLVWLLGSPHANRVNASESDRVGHRNSGAHFIFFLVRVLPMIHNKDI